MLTFNWNDWREVSDSSVSDMPSIAGMGNGPFTVSIIRITDKVEHVGDVDIFTIDTADGSLQLDTAQLVRSDTLDTYYLFVVSRKLGGKYVVDSLNQVAARDVTTRALARNLVPINGR